MKRQKFCMPEKTLTRDGQYFDPLVGVRVILRTGSESLQTHDTRHPTTIPHSAFNVTALDTPQASRLSVYS
jgi:hypothetical protein